MSASKNLGKVFMTPKGIWDKTLNYTKLDIVTNKVGKISCGYIATTDIEKNVEITDNRWLKLFELLDGDLTEEYKAVQTDVTNKATDVDTNKKAVDLIYSQMQKLYDVEISTTTPTNERTGLWINPDDISSIINIPEIKDNEVSDVDTWSSKKIDNVTNSLKEDISTKITKFYACSQGETHLADSDNGKIMDMMVYGRSEQKQYSGKNLLNATFKTDTYSGVALTNNGDGTYTIEGTNNSSGELTFPLVPTVDEQKALYNSLIGKNVKFIVESGSTISGSVGRICFVFYNKTENRYSNETYNGGNVTVPTGYDLSVVDIHINVGQTVPKTIIKPMITTDLTATYDDFEPYTGGIPSPNPDYPQEIKSVVNPTVKVCGKNLLNLNSYKENVKNGITITPIFNNEELQYLILNGTFKTVEWAVIWIGTLNPGTYTFSAQNSNVKVLRNWNEQNNTFTVTDENSVYRIVTNSSNMGESVKNVKIYPQLELGSTPTPYEPYHEQTVTLPYTLNAIPVSSGGNVTIDGQQYIADYVDVERGKLVRCVKKLFLKQYQWPKAINKGVLRFYASTIDAVGIDGNKIIKNAFSISSHFAFVTSTPDRIGTFTVNSDGTNANVGFAFSTDTTITSDDFNNWILNNKPFVFLPVLKEESPLTSEQILALKKLSTYYPVTNISINSEQLDGYTVFNYPISMANGWNYVKQQIGDTRDYIYDMDARTQDIDTQSAEAYVNSEYAVALTELEV